MKRSPKEIKENEKMIELFLKIWKERKRNGRCYSEVSGNILGWYPKKYNFDHLLEKGNPEYKHLKFKKRNIILCTEEEHTAKSNGFPLPKHKELIEGAKKELL